jgi:hypothetical protein
LNQVEFFNDLRRILTENKNIYTVCAGDWNLTYSTTDSVENIDILNMKSPPSVYRSRLLAGICEDLGFMDPFRMLHYDKKEFTYVPRHGGWNRSRLDFFLVSDNLLSICSKCCVSSSLDTVLFDHKSIKLFFGAHKKSGKHFINPTILNHPRFESVVAVAAVETYLQHAVRDQPGLDREAGLLHVGHIVDLIRQANDIEFDMAFNNYTANNELRLADLNTEIEMEINDLPDPDLLNDISLTCNPDIFLEVLMSNIRNTLISFQAWVNKTKSAKVCALNRSLSLLKADYTLNCDEIFRIESELSIIRDHELSSKIKEIKLFDHIHNEKPSPLYLNLIRKTSGEDLSGIRGDNNQMFSSAAEREEHIVSFYENIYTVPKKFRNINFDNCIENFLGPEILTNPIVTGSRLTDIEKQRLDSPLTLDELDESIKKSNKKSASGLDGFSNKLIYRCWKFFRYPLLNYSNHCFITGELTHNFRSACIKLIPKKGNLCDLKNW